MLLQVIIVLQPTKELKYLIDVLKNDFKTVIKVYEHYNHNINQSSTIN